jgi:Fe-S-cluster containining protein
MTTNNQLPTTDTDPITDTGTDTRNIKAFECKKCGNCCYGRGGIVLGDTEIKRISQFLDMSPASFITGCCEEINEKLYIITGEDGYCLFFDREKMCTIHTVKPHICSLWPFYSANLKDEYNWELAKDACPGINPDCTFEEFVKQSKE